MLGLARPCSHQTEFTFLRENTIAHTRTSNTALQNRHVCQSYLLNTLDTQIVMMSRCSSKHPAHTQLIDDVLVIQSLSLSIK